MSEFVVSTLDGIKQRLGCAFFHSWCYCVPEFVEKKDFVFSPQALSAGDLLWKDGKRGVRKIEIPEQYGGGTVVYKPVYRKNPFRCFMRLSPTAKDAVNLLMLQQLGIDTIKVLCTGEDRAFFALKRGYIITEFAEGFQDGCCFAKDPLLPGREEFIECAIDLIAKLHSLGLYHGGFKMYNLLWQKKSAVAPMHIKMLDVPTMRLFTDRKMDEMVEDVHNILHCFLPLEEMPKYVTEYLKKRGNQLQCSTERFMQEIEQYDQKRNEILKKKHSGIRKQWREIRKKLE